MLRSKQIHRKCFLTTRCMLQPYCFVWLKIEMFVTANHREVRQLVVLKERPASLILRGFDVGKREGYSGSQPIGPKMKDDAVL